jgi:recombination DNA repair RAD52 pathway protein
MGDIMNSQQYEQLLKPLNESRVAKRSQAGRSLSYLEAWDVKAHLIRIFGFLNWSADVQESVLVFEDKNEKGQWNVGYKVTLCLSFPAYGTTYTESAVGSATLPQRGEAHDMAIKTAESDALKRAAINLGTQFGLSLYNNGSLRDVVVKTLDHDDAEVSTK